MLAYFLKIPNHITKEIKNFFDYVNNSIALKSQGITYMSYPIIRGRLYVSNQGYINLGKNIIFNSSIESNWVGLKKPCSIRVEKNAVLTIGNCSGFSGVSIYCQKSITIGNNVNIGGNVFMWDTDFHPLEWKSRRIHETSKIHSQPIVIMDDVFIGANSILLKGIKIGEKAIVGAGSVVTRNIPTNEIWAGNPAKFIKKCP